MQFSMRRPFTLEYWQDGPWVVGRLVEVPGVFSQGRPWRSFARTSRTPTN
jgi:hypothetical protein